MLKRFPKRIVLGKTLKTIMAIILTMIIDRPLQVQKIRHLKKWAFVYGRRKTGKTFLIENYLAYDEYFFVKRSQSIISKKGNTSITYDTFIEILKRALEDKKVVVVDEFHRLGDDFFDFLHFTEKQGNLVLISSTLFLSKKLLAIKSPLLGLFEENLIGLIKTVDCLKALKKKGLTKKEWLETSLLIREPIAVNLFSGKKSARENFAHILQGSMKTIPALVGEIFVEEDRSLSSIYEGILRSIANGKAISSEISSYLFARKLIKKDDPSIIQQYLYNLIEFGLIKRIQVFKRKKYLYKHISPLIQLYYYADEKYNLSEREGTKKEILRIVDDFMPRVVEDQIRTYIAEKHGLIETILQTKEYEVDACLVKFKKPEILLEIKWKKMTNKDVNKIEKKLKSIHASKKLLFVMDKTQLQSKELEIIDPTDL